MGTWTERSSWEPGLSGLHGEPGLSGLHWEPGLSGLHGNLD